jgi:hypothetical protein
MTRPGRIKQLLLAGVVGCALTGGATIITGCEREGPAERVGKDVDRAAEDMRDALHDPGPAERAGKKVDRALDDARDRTDRALNTD